MTARPWSVEHWLRDLRLACRGLLRAKAFTGAAVLTLAVGIAGTTAMFALIQGVLLRPLPVHDQDRLVVFWKELRSGGLAHAPFRASEIRVLAETSQRLESVAGVSYYGALRLVAVGEGSATYINSAPVTGDFFHVLGTPPALGRHLTRTDDVTGAEPVLVLSHGFWQRRYGGARDVIGRRLLVSARSFVIAGVMPPDFDYPRGADAWMAVTPFAATMTNKDFREAVERDVDVIARLRSGASREQVTSELQNLMPRLDADAPAGALRGMTAVVRSYEDRIVGDVRTSMLVLFAAVGLVLLVASANVANLLLLRGEGRRQEFAVRVALGAGRGVIARQLVAESVVLAVAAGALALTVTWSTLHVLIALIPDGLPRVDSIRMDARVLLFTLAVAFLSAALAGIFPSFTCTRIDLVSQLRNGGRGSSGVESRLGRRVLVVVQVTLAVAIVAAAGLLTRSLLRLQSVNMGLAADRLVFIPLTLPHAKYAARERHLQFLNDVIAQLEAAPEIASATPVNVLPFSGTGGWELPQFTAEGQDAQRAAINPSLNMEAIHPNYFETFQVAVVRGRPFANVDRQDAPSVAIVSEDLAARLWPGEDPIGKRLKFGGVEFDSPWRTIVGIARPTRYRELREARPTLYLPAEQFLVTATTLALRTSSPPAVVTRLVRDRLRLIDPDVQVIRVAPFAELLEEPLARPRFNAYLISSFGVAALLLAAIGLYAVMAASVRQRYTEIGVRVALGATTSDVRSLVLGEGLRLAGLGAAVGLALAMMAMHLLRSLLFEVEPLDPAVMVFTALLVVGAAALASYLPARRVMRLEIMTLLRVD